jgi:hypothetical protein
VYNRLGVAYADDKELWLTCPEMDLVHLVSNMQEIAKDWEQLIFITGGALALEMCFDVILQWQLSNNEHIICPPAAINTFLLLTFYNN